MTATDELRKLLDERGVKYGGGDAVVYFEDERGYKVSAYDAPRRYGDCILCVSHTATPEQAIAATLGKQGYYTDRDDEGTHIMCDRCGEYIGTAEEIAATLGAGTCRMIYDEEASGDELYPTEEYYCSECGGWVYAGKPNFCPNCGRKVEG